MSGHEHSCGHDEDDERDVIALEIFTRVAAKLTAHRETQPPHEPWAPQIQAEVAFDAAEAFMTEWRKWNPRHFGLDDYGNPIPEFSHD